METDKQTFSADKPVSCKYCYYWLGKKKGCELESCYYLMGKTYADCGRISNPSSSWKLQHMPIWKSFALHWILYRKNLVGEKNTA